MSTSVVHVSDGATEADLDAILRLHRDWWEANAGVDVPRMVACFPVGLNYLMFNTNGHPYFGIEEKRELWEWYKPKLEILPGEVRIMRCEVRGDAGWIASESTKPVKRHVHVGELVPRTTEPDAVLRTRATEVYVRDDGDGDADWRMWHFHASAIAPPAAPRPVFGDSAEQRGGLGWVPYGEPLSVAWTPATESEGPRS